MYGCVRARCVREQVCESSCVPAVASVSTIACPHDGTPMVRARPPAVPTGANACLPRPDVGSPPRRDLTWPDLARRMDTRGEVQVDMMERWINTVFDTMCYGTSVAALLPADKPTYDFKLDQWGVRPREAGEPWCGRQGGGQDRTGQDRTGQDRTGED